MHNCEWRIGKPGLASLVAADCGLKIGRSKFLNAEMQRNLSVVRSAENKFAIRDRNSEIRDPSDILS
jgi:hypothetical protein